MLKILILISCGPFDACNPRNSQGQLNSVQIYTTELHNSIHFLTYGDLWNLYTNVYVGGGCEIRGACNSTPTSSFPPYWWHMHYRMTKCPRTVSWKLLKSMLHARVSQALSSTLHSSLPPFCGPYPSPSNHTPHPRQKPVWCVRLQSRMWRRKGWTLILSGA